MFDQPFTISEYTVAILQPPHVKLPLALFSLCL